MRGRAPRGVRSAWQVGGAVLWLAALVLPMAGTLRGLAVPSWGNPLGESLSPELHVGVTVEQSFLSPMPGLSGVEVTISAEASGESRPVTLRLTDAKGTLLGEKRLVLGPASSTTPMSLDVPPAARSQGGLFVLSLSSDAKPGQGVRVSYGPSSTLIGASARLDGRPIEGNLQFQTHYSLTIRQKLGLILGRLEEERAGSLGAPWFYVLIGVAYACLLYLFLRQVARHVDTGVKGQP